VAINQNSPNTRESDCGIDPTEGLPTKQASRFSNLLWELIPYKQNRTAPFKMIAGHDTTAGVYKFLSLQRKPIV
jgi:hypothetical protein